jgi:hypothetical protein
MLSAGEARRIEFVADNLDPVVQKIAASPDRLIRKSERAGSRRIPVFGAQASSTFSNDLDANNLIDGSGLVGERHSAIVKDTMWYAAPGKIEGEYVLFDLGRLHQLESMKVWNYNDEYTGEYRWRGVKQADIYVSDTSKGLPREASGDWRLVAADVQFEPGTGTADYSTPTVIPLGGVKARFVAIVIDKALGHDPRGAAAEPDGVGLSEVQFFGERVTPATSQKQKD